jgi:hypothetical protein
VTSEESRAAFVRSFFSSLQFVFASIGMEADSVLPGSTGPSPRQGSTSSSEQSASTINRNISVKYPQAINTFAVDSTGGFAALAG